MNTKRGKRRGGLSKAWKLFMPKALRSPERRSRLQKTAPK